MSDGTIDSPEIENEYSNNTPLPEPALTLPPIAGFWRRFLAWFIDSSLLGLIGFTISLVFSDFFYKIGPYGRLLGLLFVIPYFGIMNSNIGGGQTLGKRLLKLAVRDGNNETIGLGRSIIRIVILYLPVLFNGWTIPTFNNYIFSWIASLIVFGLGGVILYTMIFNRNPRQGFHDLLVGTYVVNLRGKPVASMPVTSKLHMRISIAWIGLVALGSVAILFISPNQIFNTPLSPIKTIYDDLSKDPRFFSVTVNDHTVYGSNKKDGRVLIISGWYKGKFTNDIKEQVFNDVAKVVIENVKDIEKYDVIQLRLTSAFDIGIATGNYSEYLGLTVQEWRDRLSSDESPIGNIPQWDAFHLPG